MIPNQTNTAPKEKISPTNNSLTRSTLANMA
jgi:hypothetical protein